MRILSIHLFSYLKLYYYNEFLTIELNEQKLQNKIREASRSETSPLFFLISLSALNLKKRVQNSFGLIEFHTKIHFE